MRSTCWGLTEWRNSTLGRFIAAYGPLLNAVKTNAMIYLLLPLRVGFDHAVTPMTWGFQWSATISASYVAIAILLAA